MVTLTICTYCDAPTAPLASGGTNANPKTRRLSAADCPSNPITVETPASGPPSGAETPSARPLERAARAARGSAISWSACADGARAPTANWASGCEVSCRAFFTTLGPAANADVAQRVKSEDASNRETRLKSGIGGNLRSLGDVARGLHLTLRRRQRRPRAHRDSRGAHGGRALAVQFDW